MICSGAFRFDTGGPGSCLRRYSDPTFFRRVSAGPGEKNVGKVRGDKKARKMKVLFFFFLKGSIRQCYQPKYVISLLLCDEIVRLPSFLIFKGILLVAVSLV